MATPERFVGNAGAAAGCRSGRRGGRPGGTECPGSVVGPERDAARDQHLVDHAFADDGVELVLDLSPQGFEARLRPAAQLLRVALGNDGADAVFNQGRAVGDPGLDRFLALALGDDEDADVEQERPAADLVGGAEVQDLDLHGLVLLRRLGRPVLLLGRLSGRRRRAARSRRGT